MAVFATCFILFIFSFISKVLNFKQYLTRTVEDSLPNQTKIGYCLYSTVGFTAKLWYCMNSVSRSVV